jgi:phosphoglucosamine mutase
MALFGTDGVRGVANKDLTAELALDLAVAAAHVLAEGGEFAGHKPKAIVGQDSRASGEFLEAAVCAGLASAGVDVYRVGILPTPAVAHLVSTTGADLGVMISASHNPMPDNGIKFFARGGGKLDDALEAAIEKRLGEPWDRPTGKDVGRIIIDESAREAYVTHLLHGMTTSLNGLKVVVDCANGASSFVAPDAYRRAGAEVSAISHTPNGLNINDNCGSTHLAHLKREVLAQKADIGIAHDGDADRVLAIDHLGNEIDGDFILAILANSLHKTGSLTHSTVVGTVMSNLGFIRAMEKLGITVVTTAVGDRYVLERMQRENFVLGGEQSGHIIMRQFAQTGDGILTALHLMQEIVKSGKSLAENSTLMARYPQVLVNVSGVNKNEISTNTALQSAVADITSKLGTSGRVLLRASGTEPLIRVMVEAESLEHATSYANELAALVKSELAL